jgi:hypothetical protein
LVTHLGSNNPSEAVTQAGYIINAFGIENVIFQIGNEPDNWYSPSTYTSMWNDYFSSLSTSYPSRHAAPSMSARSLEIDHLRAFDVECLELLGGKGHEFAAAVFVSFDDLPLSISSPVPGSCGRSAIRVAASSGLHQGWYCQGIAAVPMAQSPAALQPDPISRPRP